MTTVRNACFAAVLSIAGSSVMAQVRPIPLGEESFVEVEIRRWQSDLDSELRLSTPALPGTDFDPVRDLGVPSKRTLDYHVGVRVARRLKLRGNWYRVSYEADTIVGGGFSIAGSFFPSGSTVSIVQELEQRRGGIEFDVLRGDYGFVAVVGEWARFQATGEFSSGATVATPAPQSMNLPLFGVKTRVYLTPALAATADAVGMKRESIGVMTDVDLAVTYNAIPNLAFSYGYRNAYNRFKDIEPDSRAIYRLKGQYFGVTIRF